MESSSLAEFLLKRLHRLLAIMSQERVFSILLSFPSYPLPITIDSEMYKAVGGCHSRWALEDPQKTLDIPPTAVDGGGRRRPRRPESTISSMK